MTDIEAQVAITIEDLDKALSLSELTADRNQALQAIRTHHQTKKAELGTLNFVSATEKATFEGQLDAALNLGVNEVTDAESLVEIHTGRDEAITAMNTIVDNATTLNEKNRTNKIDTLISDLDAKAKAARDQITALTHLTDAQKTQYINNINTELQGAKADLATATTPTAMDALHTQALEIFDDQVKQAQIQDDLEGYRKEQLAAVTSAHDDVHKILSEFISLTDAEKQALYTELDDIEAQAITDINNTSDKATMLSIADAAQAQMYGLIQPLIDDEVKEQSKVEIEKEAENSKKEIDDLPNLSPKEKEDLKKEIDDVVQKGKDQIDANTDPNEVLNIEKEVQTEIDKIKKEAELQDQKNAEKNQLDKEGDTAKKDIDDMTHLSPKEKEDLKKDIDDAVQKGKDQIDGSNDAQAIGSIADDTVNTINTIVDNATK